MRHDLPLAALTALAISGCVGGHPDPATTPPSGAADSPNLVLHTRARAEGEDGQVELEHRRVEWRPEHTAIIVCDMWDDHWCAGAARRVTEMAEPMNEMLSKARDRGVFIIHAPSSVVDFYERSPQRARARSAPHAAPTVALSTSERWGTRWCWPDPELEPPLPIDDSDMGCDCDHECEISEAWTRQIASLHIHTRDAITDDGQETFNLLTERGIEHVVLVGVHLNMCVLGRPFGIRQMVKLGKDVLLMRDMTDSMYDSDSPPYVDHFTGNDLVVEHVEQFWCPTFLSTDITGRLAFRFTEDRRDAAR